MAVTELEKELIVALKKRTDLDQEERVGIGLMVARGNENGESNCRQMIEFLKTNPTIEEIQDKVDEILGIEISDEDYEDY